jgi:hypothetical protein
MRYLQGQIPPSKSTIGQVVSHYLVQLALLTNLLYVQLLKTSNFCKSEAFRVRGEQAFAETC